MKRIRYVNIKVANYSETKRGTFHWEQNCALQSLEHVNSYVLYVYMSNSTKLL